MTSLPAVPTRWSSPLVPTIVATCPKQVCEAAVAEVPWSASALSNATAPCFTDKMTPLHALIFGTPPTQL